jgi:hypothetical protein
MKFKLTKLHLFIILLSALILSSLGIKVLESFNIIEGNSNMEDGGDGESKTEQPPLTDADGNEASSGDEYNPNNNAENNALSDLFKDDYENTTFQPDLRVTFQDTDANKSKLSFGAKNGVTKDLIPPGEEHLYVLKSQMVPPICPQCPKIETSKGSGCGEEKTCPPCPRPERCPEPAFSCKKVPNYSASNVNSILPTTMDGTAAGAGNGKPVPVLNSFASFS